MQKQNGYTRVMNKHGEQEELGEEEEFSVTLDNWLKSDEDKTVASLSDVFAEKAFAITFLILMAIPALPAPTGGLTHIFEIIVMLLCLELIAQRRSIWLPKRWRNKHLGKLMEEKTIPKLIKFISKLERFSKPRMSRFIESRIGTTIFGLLVLGFTVDAFFAPPFSGLDTLPSIGVLILSLGVIFGDVIFYIAGSVIGSAGVFVTVFLGQAAFNFIKDLFN